MLLQTFWRFVVLKNVDISSFARFYVLPVMAISLVDNCSPEFSKVA